MTPLGWREIQDKDRGRTRPRPASIRTSPEARHLTSVPQEAVTMQAIWLFCAGGIWGFAVGLVIAGVLR